MTDPERPLTEFEVDELVRRSKDVCLHDYPNPDRVGCPSDEAIESLANEDLDLRRQDELISHIVTCSPCFQKHVACRERLRSRNRLKIAALSTAAVLLLVFAVLTVRNLTMAPGQTGISKGGVPPRVPEPKAQAENQARATGSRNACSKARSMGLRHPGSARTLARVGRADATTNADLARERLDLEFCCLSGPVRAIRITVRDWTGTSRGLSQQCPCQYRRDIHGQVRPDGGAKGPLRFECADLERLGLDRVRVR